jgi:hypothetical protein
VSAPDPRLALTKVRVLFVPEPRDPVVSGPDPAQGGSEARPRGPGTPVEVLYLTRRSGPYVQGSGPTADALEHIVFFGHVAAPKPSAWWGRVLFATRLEIAVWTLHLHTVVRDIPVSGYRQVGSTSASLGHRTLSGVPG